jgi:hypothetical protein
MGAKSKRKGNASERELTTILSGIFTGSFVRVPSSGGFVGGKNVHRRQTLSTMQDRSFRGDIIPPDHLPRLVIECKAYQQFRFHQLMQPGPCPLLDDWIGQTLAVLDPGDQWFVSFKVTRLGWFVAAAETECPDYQFANYCAYTGANGACRVTDMMHFFRTNREAILRKAGPMA